MIRISISPPAYAAIAATLPLGSVSSEHEPDAKSERLIWIERFWRVQLVRLTVLSAQTSTLDTSAD
jgi:hypothetical protein